MFQYLSLTIFTYHATSTLRIHPRGNSYVSRNDAISCRVTVLFFLSKRIICYFKISNRKPAFLRHFINYAVVLVQLFYFLCAVLSMGDSKESDLKGEYSRGILLPTLVEMNSFTDGRPTPFLHFRLYILVMLFTLNESTNLILVELVVISRCMH